MNCPPGQKKLASVDRWPLQRGLSKTQFMDGPLGQKKVAGVER